MRSSRKKIIITTVITFCIAMMPMVCFADEETTGTLVAITNTANVQTAAPGDEVTFTISASLTGEAGEFILTPYIIDDSSDSLENLRIQSVVGTQGASSTPLNVGYRADNDANGNMTIHFWDSEEFNDSGQKLLFVGSQVNIVVQAKIADKAPAGKLYNKASQFGTYSMVNPPDEKANATASITVQVDSPDPTKPMVSEPEKNVRNVSDESPKTGDESFLGFICALLFSIL